MRSNYQKSLVFVSFLLLAGSLAAQNIGINTDGSAGSTLLHTKNTAAATDNILRIENTIATQKSGVNFLNSGTANSDWLFHIPASSTDLRLQNYAGTDAVTFLNDGKVGIGTTSPSWLLTNTGSGSAANTEYIIGAFNQVTSLGGVYMGYYTDGAGTALEGRVRAGASKELALGTTSFPRSIYIANATGYVSVGSTAPASRLEVFNGDFTIRAGATFPDDPGDIIFKNNGGTQKARIWSSSTAATSLNMNGDGTGTAAIHINASGNVGVGTSNPLGKLHVGSGYATTGLSGTGSFYMAGNGASPNAGQIVWGDNTGWKFHFGTVSAGNFVERLTIMDQGNVGIGTTAPANKLTISSATALDGIYQTDGTRWMKYMSGTTGAGSYNNLMQANDNAIIFSGGAIGTGGLVIGPWISATAAGIRIDNAGNVGVGTSSPSYKLDIVSGASGGILVTGPASGNGMVQIRDNDNAAGPHLVIWPNSSGNGVLRFQKSGISSWDLIDRSTSNDAAGTAKSLAIRNNNLGASDIITFLGSGNVGIGTTTPKGILHLENGNARITTYDTDAAGPSAARPAWLFGAQGPAFAIQSAADYTTAVTWLSIAPVTGTVTVASLAGTGTALLQADASGNISRSSPAAGNVVLLYNNETSVSGFTYANTTAFSYNVVGTYSQVKVEADIENDCSGGADVSLQGWNFKIVYNGVTKRTAQLWCGDKVSNDDWMSGHVSYMGAVANGQTVKIDVINQGTAGTWYVRNFRVYGVY